MTFHIRPMREADLEAVRAILNHEIRHSVAVWHQDERSPEAIRAWFEERRAGGYPLLAAETPEGRVVGYAACGPFRAYAGYRFTAEHSVYAAPDARGQGVGKALLAALVEAARATPLRVLVGAIAAENTTSIALHEALGFVETGRMPGVGEKFGRRLTLVFMQIELRPSPAD